MKHSLNIAFIILITTQLSYSQLIDDGRYLKWKFGRKLSYRDFQMDFKKYNKDTGLFRNYADAECGLYFEYNVFDDTLDYEVYAYFDKDSSLAFPTTPKNRIEHEQIEFDLCELYARKLKYYMQNLLNKRNVTVLPDYFENLTNDRLSELADVPFDINNQKIISRKILKKIDSLSSFVEIKGKVILR